MEVRTGKTSKRAADIFAGGGTGFDSIAAGFLMGVVLVFIFRFVAAVIFSIRVFSREGGGDYK